VSNTLFVDFTSLPNSCQLERLNVPQIFDLHFHKNFPIMSRGYNQRQITRATHSKITTVAVCRQGRSTMQTKLSLWS